MQERACAPISRMGQSGTRWLGIGCGVEYTAYRYAQWTHHLPWIRGRCIQIKEQIRPISIAVGLKLGAKCLTGHWRSSLRVSGSRSSAYAEPESEGDRHPASAKACSSLTRPACRPDQQQQELDDHLVAAARLRSCWASMARSSRLAWQGGAVRRRNEP